MDKNKTSIFTNKNFMLLWFGQLISSFGNNFSNIASMWYVYQKTGSAMKMGTMLLFAILPAVLTGPLAGTLADRWNRKKIIVISDFINGCLVGAIALLMYFNILELWVLYILIGLSSITSAFFSPAISAAIPVIVHKDELIKANSLNQLSKNLTGVFGPIFGGVLVSIIGIPGLFLLDAISFILSSISETFINIPTVERNNIEKKNLLEDMVEGLKYCVQNKKLLYFIIVAGFIVNFFLAPLQVFITLISGSKFNAGSQGFGTLMSALAVGSLIMAAIMPMITKKIDYFVLASIGLFAEGFCVVMIGISNTFNITIIAMALLGVSLCICNVALSTVFQSIVPNNMMGRVAGSSGIISQITTPLGIFVGGLALENYSVTAMMIVSGSVVGIAGLSTIKMVFENSRKKENGLKQVS